MTRSEWQAKADDLAQRRVHGEIDDAAWFDRMAAIFGTAYLSGDNPRAQSGFGGDERRWEVARRPIADAIDGDGSFLDVGCASGYLMECVVRWSSHVIEPYGLELVPVLAALARRRLPHWADRIFVGNALTWRPPMRFDFVRTELVYVPEERQHLFLERLLNQVVSPGGRLMCCGYGSPRAGLPTHPVCRIVRSLGYEPEEELEFEAPEGGGSILDLALLRLP
jgi:SAM-dependent methyltransferase